MSNPVGDMVPPEIPSAVSCNITSFLLCCSCSSLRFASLHLTLLHFTSLHFTLLHFTSLHFISLRFSLLSLPSKHTSHTYLHLCNTCIYSYTFIRSDDEGSSRVHLAAQGTGSGFQEGCSTGGKVFEGDSECTSALYAAPATTTTTT